MNRFLLLFIDGIGLGKATRENPFTRDELPGFTLLSDGQQWTDESVTVNREGISFQHIDACLGIPGLPQSGTGQATLFTGVNCAALAGRHFGPFPHSTSRQVIAEHNIFKEIGIIGGSAAFVNAYPPKFFEYVRRRNRWSVTTRCCLDSGTPIRTLDDLIEGRALAADITGARLQAHLGPGVDPITEEEAAHRLSDIAARHSFTAFEYFLTDKAGHARSIDAATECLRSIDRLVAGLAARSFNQEFTLIVTSDHGNMEDLSVKTHTRNRVPLAAFGPDADAFHGASSLTDVVPSILRAQPAQ